MTDCRVTCQQCRTQDGPRVWRWLCETCAEECQEQHKRDSGHVTTLTVVPDEMDGLITQLQRASRVLGRFGW